MKEFSILAITVAILVLINISLVEVVDTSTNKELIKDVFTPLKQGKIFRSTKEVRYR